MKSYETYDDGSVPPCTANEATFEHVWVEQPGYKFSNGDILSHARCTTCGMLRSDYVGCIYTMTQYLRSPAVYEEERA